jgi:hypothetical protein
MTKINAQLGIFTEPMRRKELSLFRVDLDPEGEGVTADEGSRPGSISFGLSLEPVVLCPGSGDHVGSPSLYCDACGQKVNEVPFGAVPDHETTQECIDAYDMNPQDSALWFDVTREELVGLIAQFQRVLKDNDEYKAWRVGDWIDMDCVVCGRGMEVAPGTVNPVCDDHPAKEIA